MPTVQVRSIFLTRSRLEQTAADPVPPRDLRDLRARHHCLGDKPGLLFRASLSTPFELQVAEMASILDAHRRDYNE